MKSVSMKFARTLSFGLWTVASMALAGQGKSSSPACYEGGPQGKAVTTAKTQEECQKLGEKFVWTEAEHKAHKAKGKVKQQAKSEAKPAAAEMAPEATQTPAPTAEAPKK